jgi:hypothetical protein
MSVSGGFWDGYPPDAAICQRCGHPAVGWAMIGLRRFCFQANRLCCYKVETFDLLRSDRQGRIEWDHRTTTGS